MVKEYRVCGLTIDDLLGLSAIKLEPGHTWTLVCPKHEIKEEFVSGLLGKNGFQLLEVISKIYDKANKQRPPRHESVKDDDGSTLKYEISFWGDHHFLEIISIDEDKKEVSLYFGS